MRGKRRRPEVAALLFRCESTPRAIGEALRDGAWRHGPFQLLYLRNPKPRVIAKAALEDRVVQTALVELLTPASERS